MITKLNITAKSIYILLASAVILTVGVIFVSNTFAIDPPCGQSCAELPDNINDIEVISRKNAWIVGPDGNVWNYDGQEWFDHTPDSITGCSGGPRWECADIHDVSASANDKIWIVGASGEVWSNDGTGTGGWTDRDQGNDVPNVTVRGVSAIQIGTSNKAWIVGSNGNVWKFNGSVWRQEDENWTGQFIQFNSASVLSETEVWIAGNGGNVWECTAADIFPDGACSWEDHTPGVGVRWGTADIESISAYSSDNVWIAGDSGEVWKWDGTSWTEHDGANCNNNDPAVSCWGITNMRDVSNRYSGAQWVVGASGNVFEYRQQGLSVGECSGTDCSSDDDVVVNGVTYNRNFYLQNVCRDDSTQNITGVTDNGGVDTGSAACGDNGGTHDPSTLKVTVSVSWTGGETVTKSDYVTRWQTGGCVQTQWADSGATGYKLCSIDHRSDEYDDTNGNINVGDTLNMNESALEPGTGTLTSAVFDTTLMGEDDKGGATFNSIEPLGTKGQGGNRVEFQLAVSDCPNGAINPPTCGTGSWRYTNLSSSCTFGGWTNINLGVDDPYYIRCADMQDKRFFKYRIKLCAFSDCMGNFRVGDEGPEVTDIIINYSP